MGSYPNQYSKPAIIVAEPLVSSATQNRLVKDKWRWSTQRALLSCEELNEIRYRFAPGVSDEELLRFVGLVFSKVQPEMHYEFVSDGFYLTTRESRDGTEIVVGEHPQCLHGYRSRSSQGAYRAALVAVRSLIEWRLASYRGGGGGYKWPIHEWGGADLIYGELYDWIKGLGQFTYCRTQNVIELMREAVPDMFAEWEEDGLVLTPIYHTGYNSPGRFTTLQLVPKTSV